MQFGEDKKSYQKKKKTSIIAWEKCFSSLSVNICASLSNSSYNSHAGATAGSSSCEKGLDVNVFLKNLVKNLLKTNSISLTPR